MALLPTLHDAGGYHREIGTLGNASRERGITRYIQALRVIGLVNSAIDIDSGRVYGRDRSRSKTGGGLPAKLRFAGRT